MSCFGSGDGCQLIGSYIIPKLDLEFSGIYRV